MNNRLQPTQSLSADVMSTDFDVLQGSGGVSCSEPLLESRVRGV